MEKRDNQKMIQKVARESGGTYSRGIKAKAPMHYKKKKSHGPQSPWPLIVIWRSIRQDSRADSLEHLVLSLSE